MRQYACDSRAISFNAGRNGRTAMCRGGDKKSCTELGSNPAIWSKTAPLIPPVWFDGQLTIFEEAVRLASIGEVEKAHEQLRLIRSGDLQSWFIEHGQMSGEFRKRHFDVARPVVAVEPDPVRSPAKLEAEVFKRDGYRCRYCGLRLVPMVVLKAFSNVVGRDAFRPTGKNMERHGMVFAFRGIADHVMPWKLGGRTDLDNLVSACWSCNYGKSGYTVEQLGVDDPRGRPVSVSDGWDGLKSFLPALKASVRNHI
jgi:5-methylcytosine-specific restriction endonuclease McrA